MGRRTRGAETGGVCPGRTAGGEAGLAGTGRNMREGALILLVLIPSSHWMVSRNFHINSQTTCKRTLSPFLRNFTSEIVKNG